MHNEELHNMYTPPNIIRVYHIKENKMDGSCSMHGTDVIFIKNSGQKS
jgi:hypothetical protein